MTGAQGEMNEYRRGLTKKAYAILDKDGSGIVNIEDIRSVYNARQHPDVIEGKKTEDEILSEFLDTFEAQYSFNV